MLTRSAPMKRAPFKGKAQPKREVEQFIGHVVGNARRQQREAFAAQIRGAINTVENDQ